MTHILMVCSGNICRSPFAEEAARHRFTGGDITVSSAGSIAVAGQPATALMREVAGEHGLDLSAHRATPLHRSEQPDYVFGMELEHLVAARQVFPDLDPGRIRLLDHPRDIADPYGRDRTAYRATADQIIDAVSRLDAPA
ncbi:MAG: hypothetical protein QNJ71_06270 [Acidimicrobiia bacterium]|nr:hypothetical protein [Acidimicrobiia bacterium]